MSLKQVAMTDFMRSISAEQILLDSLVKRAEMAQRIDSMPAERRKTYQELLDTLRAEHEDGVQIKEIYKWEKISKPNPVDDAEIQIQIEAEYANVMEDRNKRFFDIKTRCHSDPQFARILSQKMAEAEYPMEHTIKIIPMPQFLEHTRSRI